LPASGIELCGQVQADAPVCFSAAGYIFVKAIAPSS